MCNGYPTFEQGPQYLVQGSFALCNYGFPGDGAFGISMNEMTACAREGWPAVTLVIVRDFPWSVELDPRRSRAGVAEACGVKRVTAPTMQELTTALSESCEAQAVGVTAFIEVILNQELGKPFRWDAMTKPDVVAGIGIDDMRHQ